MHTHTNPPSATADAADPLDAVLRQIAAGCFVLTDAQGSVSKWSEPAELLFDRPAEAILGQNFFAALIAGPVPPDGEAWREFLDAGEPPRVPGTVTLTGRRRDGEDFPLEAVFVPVKLDEGFDFSLFLEDLSLELPLNLMLARMRQQHPVVMSALRQAIEPEAQPWEGSRTAGTLVIFRPLSATPWVQAELARRATEREAAGVAAQERLTNPDPGIQGALNDLDDAAAVVARLLSAVERIDALERVADEVAALRAELSELRHLTESALREAEHARETAQQIADGSTERVTEVLQQILGLATARNGGHREPAATSPAHRAASPEREPRHGFDDAPAPMATLGLDGKFKQLNPAFAKLVGYQEHEFSKAAWPSPHDRSAYQDQLEQLRRLATGELREIEFQSTYMHGQGLMIPVIGKLIAELGEDGRPIQLVLEAQDRHTA